MASYFTSSFTSSSPPAAPAVPSEEEGRAEIAQSASSEEGFEDALQDDDDEGVKGDFEVTDEELSMIRAELAMDFPDDYLYLSDAYITSVASKPYSKDPTVRRPLAYTKAKLKNVMKWRAEEGAPEMEDLVRLANGPETAPEAVEQPDKLLKAKALVTSLNGSSLYFHGLTKDGRPILWVRTNRKPWYPDVDAEVNCLMLMSDAGIKAMPPGVTDFVTISESSYPPPPHPTFMIKMLKALVMGYPDRLHQLFSAPSSSIVKYVMDLLLPLMPGRLASKVILLTQDEIATNMKELLMNGEDDIPTFFGGTADHDKLYPDQSYAPNRGQGTLKFDYFGMVERLQKESNKFQATQEEAKATAPEETKDEPTVDLLSETTAPEETKGEPPVDLLS